MTLVRLKDRTRKCPVCGERNHTCGPPSKSSGELITQRPHYTGAVGLYEIPRPNGRGTMTVRMRSDEAAAKGAKPIEQKKADAPNKARTGASTKKRSTAKNKAKAKA